MKTKKPVRKFRVGQLVEYHSSDARTWCPAKVKEVSFSEEEGFTYLISPDELWCLESEIRIPKTKRLQFSKFIERFRVEYKRLTKKTFPTFNELMSSRHPDLMGLAEAHEENWSPKKTAKSYVGE